MIIKSPRKIRFAHHAARRAFTLVELLVVIVILGLLSTIAILAVRISNRDTRNSVRKSNLIQISKALELYREDYGEYPKTNDAWQGACQSYGDFPDAYVDPSHDAWIPGLTPIYLKSLPRDPHTDQVNPYSDGAACQSSPGQNCYLFRSDGTDYALLAHCTPEGHLSAEDPFFARSSGKGLYAWEICTPGGCTKW